MFFNSLGFLIFLPVTVLAYFIVPIKFRHYLLLLSSVVFYLSFSISFIFILLASVFINYFLGIYIDKATGKNRKYILHLGVALNILVLCFYKTANILVEELAKLSFLSFLHLNEVSSYLLPIGISYYTFSNISYLIDVFKSKTVPEKRIDYYLTFIIFFPKILQGPIERACDLIPQFKQPHPFNYNDLLAGSKLIIWGFFKKLVIADRLGILVNMVFDNPHQYGGFSLTLAALFFAFQVYADFSGYTDIALGVSRIFGIKLTQNFNKPYFATSIQEFWSKWHISLTSWLFDYIYKPTVAKVYANFLSPDPISIGSSKSGKKERQFQIRPDIIVYLVSTLTTFLICGLWHEVSWTFLLWGLCHAIYLVFAVTTKKTRKKITNAVGIQKLPILDYLQKVLLTFFFIYLALILVRANNLGDAFYIYKNIFNYNDLQQVKTALATPWALAPFYGLDKFELLLSFLAIIVLLVVDYLSRKCEITDIFKNSSLLRFIFFYLLILGIVIFGNFGIANFIYVVY